MNCWNLGSMISSASTQFGGTFQQPFSDEYVTHSLAPQASALPGGATSRRGRIPPVRRSPYCNPSASSGGVLNNLTLQNVTPDLSSSAPRPSPPAAAWPSHGLSPFAPAPAAA